MNKKILIAAGAFFALSCNLFNRSSRSRISPSVVTVKIDSSKKDTLPKLKPYADVITAKAVTQSGLIKVHKVETRWFFEIADSLLNKDILIVNRISKSAAAMRFGNGMLGYGGDLIGENVVQFTKGANHKLYIKRISYIEISKDSSENGMRQSVKNSSIQPIVSSFDIKTMPKDSAGYVIDVTDYLNTENDVFFFDNRLKKVIALGALMPDRSYIDKVLTFPLNTEIKTVRTYIVEDQPATFELNSSIVLLPATPMKPRLYDERVGYFSRGYLDYDNTGGVQADFMTTRWKLEPKEEDIPKYLRGELVEPKNPIVFYLDPAMPKKWRPYMIRGVNAWQKAFEKAGFKNAIYALEAPVNDSTWSIEDARHNVIVYKASPVANASGPQLSDPRSGQILESHINWYHNVQQILHDLYFIQASATDPAARKMEYNDTLMGKLIQYVCTHEVGHTLGLQHNFVASASIPVDSLRSRNYVMANGHTPSIMDYARFNYVAQPEDNIPVEKLIPGIGVYDEWAIEWGYRWFPDDKTKEQEKIFMNNWVNQQLKKDPRCFFASYVPIDPRNQMEDLGDDPVKASAYGIQNLKRIYSHLEEWTKTDDKNFDDLNKMSRLVRNQYFLYLNLVMKNIGGMYYTPQTAGQGGRSLFSFPPREKIKASVKFLQDNLFDTPQWLLNKDLFAKGAGTDVINLVNLQEWITYQLQYPATWNWLVFNETNQSKDKSYSYEELLNDMETGIWKELDDRKPIDIYRRSLQKMYVYHLVQNIKITREGDSRMLDCSTITLEHIKNLAEKITRSLSGYIDKTSIAHLQDLQGRLRQGIKEQAENFATSPGDPFRYKVDKMFSPENFKPQLKDIFAPAKNNAPGCWSVSWLNENAE